MTLPCLCSSVSACEGACQSGGPASPACALGGAAHTQRAARVARLRDPLDEDGGEHRVDRHRRRAAERDPRQRVQRPLQLLRGQPGGEHHLHDSRKWAAFNGTSPKWSACSATEKEQLNSDESHCSYLSGQKRIIFQKRSHLLSETAGKTFHCCAFRCWPLTRRKLASVQVEVCP